MKQKIFTFFSIFLIVAGTVMFSGSLIVHGEQQELPSWVKKGAYASYKAQPESIAIKYDGKYYIFPQETGWANLTWKIVAVSGDIVTLDMRFTAGDLTYGGLHFNSVPEPVKKLFTVQEDGFYFYHDEHTFKVNFIKREIVSNGGRINLWVVPAIDVTWDKNKVTSVQKDPDAVPVVKYAGTEYVPKVMIFPTDIKEPKLHIYDPYRMTAEVGPEDAGIMDSANITLANGTFSPYLSVSALYLRNTGIFFTGNLVDDSLFTIFHDYGAIMMQLNHTNIKAGGNGESGAPSGISWEVILTIAFVLILGVVAWILWKRRK